METCKVTENPCCKVLTPKLVEDLVSAIWAAENDGWTDNEGAKKLQQALEELAFCCNIVPVKPGVGRRYGVASKVTSLEEATRQARGM